jgi:hypothetical protein
MIKKHSKKLFLIFIIGLCPWITPMSVSAQVFDYHREESPAISWNGTPLFDARMLGAGGVSLMGSPGFMAAVNPALIPHGDKLLVAASFDVTHFEAFQYWGLNQGVLGDYGILVCPLFLQSNAPPPFSCALAFAPLRACSGYISRYNIQLSIVNS